MQHQESQHYQTTQTSQINDVYADSLQGYDPHDLLASFSLDQFSAQPAAPSDSFEGCTWPNQDDTFEFLTASLADPVQDLQPTLPLQNAVGGSVELDWRHVIGKFDSETSRLEDKLDKLEVVIKDLQTDIEEKTRFFVNVETYIKQLVEWTRNSKHAIDSLVAELKETVQLVNSK